MSQLRTYQREALAEVSRAWRDGARRVLLTMPTGSGKTRTATEAILRATARGKRCLWLVHGIELVRQAAGALRAEGLSVGVILPGERPDPAAPVQVASVDSLRSRGWQGDSPALIVPDEAHHFRAESYEAILALFPGAYLLGLTATPARADGKGLGEIFARLVSGPSVSELQWLGYLVPSEVWAPSSPLGTRALALSPVTAYLSQARGRRAAVYAGTVQEATRWAGDFATAGVRAAVLSAKTPAAERERILSDLARGDTPVVLNCGILTEGVDCPPLEVAILARRVGSLPLYLQIVGRVLRPSPETGKREALILDLAGSSLLHGLPEDEREYTLEGIKKPGEGGAGALAVCRVCGLVRRAWPCARCGYAPPQARHSVKGELLYKVAPSVRAQREQKALDTLIRKAVSNGYKSGYVIAAYQRITGRDLSREERRQIGERVEAQRI